MTGKEIKIARIEAGKKQIEVAIATGLAPSRLSVIENGWVEPRADELSAIRAALNIKETEECAASAA